MGFRLVRLIRRRWRDAADFRRYGPADFTPAHPVNQPQGPPAIFPRAVSAILLLVALLAPAVAPAPVIAQRAVGLPGGPGVVRAIRVEGNQRIEEGTIRSYMLIAPGDPFDEDRLDRSLKALFATGFFADVTLSRSGDTLVVRVEENPLVNRIAFEGNSKIKEEQLRNEIQLRPRSVFTPTLARADQRRLLDVYARQGRFGAQVEPKIIRLDQNRVDVVFEISEGNVTLVERINIVGNKEFSDGRIRDVLLTKEATWWRFLSSADTYDPDRMNFDRELIRRFYLRNGYADIQVTGAVAELTPDRRAFFLTITLDEGVRYRFGKLEVASQIRGIDVDLLRRELEMSEGDWYNSDLVEASMTRINNAAQGAGFAFAEARPRVTRNQEARTVDITFEVVEGPRIFIDRIDIVGNVRTQDAVIRRQFRIAEGDAVNQPQLTRARQRIRDLGYFEKVEINRAPGSAPDRVIVTTEIEEKATGELTLGGGYSTDYGALANIGLRERNLLGTGIDARIAALIAQKRSQVDFSITDPAFLDRNLVGGFDLYYLNINNQNISGYDEKRAGFNLRVGYEFNERMRQSWFYSLVDRDIYNIASGASQVIQEQAGKTLLSQIGQTLIYDRRDSRLEPKEGYIARLGTDFAGLGGDIHYIRVRVDGNYYFPIFPVTGTDDYILVASGSVGNLFGFDDNERIIDRFFLGGENLRGFKIGGAGPRDLQSGDSLGGTFIATASLELRFPLPVPDDFGLTGRLFTDWGWLYGISDKGPTIADSRAPRGSVGFGVGWRTPFGLINIDLGYAIVKEDYDRTELIRFGFGTRF
jgi:outer membrane protein insertion porin family